MSPDRSIALVFGTRPEAIKMGPVYRALTSEDSRFRPIVIVSGQHRELLDQMLGVFDIVPTRDLDVMTAGQTPGSLTGALVP
ncbi:MAG TPA: UDP-N-acetylglucosamine 2-epimerase (non-hydrolyzing), partial [Armatimonadota bacterium]|nr:UDP-N-acetylglucosamine 2-epimerase (non-hydrolyzing) [Armatimonadota bacterium]